MNEQLIQNHITRTTTTIISNPTDILHVTNVNTFVSLTCKARREKSINC